MTEKSDSKDLSRFSFGTKFWQQLRCDCNIALFKSGTYYQILCWI